MVHDDNAFATMLLMSQLSASREELVRPLSVREYHALITRLTQSGLSGAGCLIGMDLSAIRQRLSLDENEAYRLCVLLGRVIPLSYMLEQFSDQGIEVVTLNDAEYPSRIRTVLKDRAFPMLYTCGSLSLAEESCVAVMGNSCSAEPVAHCADVLAEKTCRDGFALLSGGENGVGTLIEEQALRCGGRVISFLAESISKHIVSPGIREMIANGRALCLSAVHPDAPYTAVHALDRSASLYALSSAAFIVSCDAEKGPTWQGALAALKDDRCVYAWNSASVPGNTELIRRGAKPFDKAEDMDIPTVIRMSANGGYEQLSLFS